METELSIKMAKARKIEDAMRQLRDEYDDNTVEAIGIRATINEFLFDAPTENKARLYDLLTLAPVPA